MIIPLSCQCQRKHVAIIVFFLLFNVVVLSYCFSTTSVATLKVIFQLVASQSTGQTLWGVNIPIIDRTMAFVGGANITRTSGSGPKPIPVDLFQKSLSRYDEILLKDIMQVFVRTISRANLTYFMYGGTLLGSYRHHGIIPWDDDIDVVMDNTQKVKLKNVLKPLEPDYILDTSGTQRWKFYSRHSKKVERKDLKWKFPFVDLCFFTVNNDYLWDSDPGYAKAFIYNKSRVFPLITRPFWNMSLKAPKDSEYFIRKTYNPDFCVSSYYNHKAEKNFQGPIVKLPCQSLWNIVPFVFRTKTPVGVNETLVVGNTTLSWKILSI